MVLVCTRPLDRGTRAAQAGTGASHRHRHKTKTVARAGVLYGAGFLASMQAIWLVGEPLMREAIALGADLGGVGAHIRRAPAAFLWFILMDWPGWP